MDIKYSDVSRPEEDVVNTNSQESNKDQQLIRSKSCTDKLL